VVSLGIHVTAAFQELGPAPMSDHPPPELPGDTTKSIIETGDVSHAGEDEPRPLRPFLSDRRKVTCHVLLREERRRSFEDLVLHLRDAQLAAQRDQLFVLVSRDARAAAVLDIGLGDPVA
jgi:hypothetical protein